MTMTAFFECALSNIKDYLAGKFRCLTLEEYGAYLKACLAQVPENVTVYRITGDGAKRDLAAPYGPPIKNGCRTT